MSKEAYFAQISLHLRRLRAKKLRSNAVCAKVLRAKAFHAKTLLANALREKALLTKENYILIGPCIFKIWHLKRWSEKWSMIVLICIALLGPW